MSFLKASIQIACALFLASVAFCQTVSTPVVGFEKKNFAAGTTGLGVGFVKPAVFSGTSTSITATSISVSGASFSSFAPTGGLPNYYVEITSGSLVGLNADILSNTGTTLTINGDLTSILGTTPQIAIRPHVKVSGLFNGNTYLTDYIDTVTVYNSDGTSTSLLRDSTAGTGWVRNDTFEASDLVVYPGQAVLLSVSQNGNVTTSGQVKTTPTLVPLYAGSLNYVTLGNPSSSQSIQNVSLGANMTDYIDTVTKLSTDGNCDQAGVYLWGGISDGFLDVNTFAPVSVTIPGTDAIFVSVSSDTVWKAPAPLNP